MCVNPVVFEVDVEQFWVNPESLHHCRPYAGLASWEYESVEAVHDQDGLLLFVGLVVDGVPGTLGGVVSEI